MLTVYIPEYIPAHNKGEEAIFLGIKKTLEDFDIKKIYLYSINPEYDAKRYGPPVEAVTESMIPIARQSKFKKAIMVIRQIPGHIIYALMRKTNSALAKKIFKKGIFKVYNEMDFVLAAHDNAYAMMHNFLIIFCKLIGVPVAVYGTSVMTYIHKKKIAKIVSKYALEQADLVTCRERLSYEIIRKKLKVSNTEVYLTADKAFVVKPSPRERGIELLDNYRVPLGLKPLIGMTAVYKTQVFVNSFGHIKGTQKQLECHWKRIAGLVDFIVEQTGGHVVFLPHSIGPREISDDRIAARGIFSFCNARSHVTLIEDDYCVADLKSVIGNFDFFIGERTHSVIGAASMLIPFLSLTYSQDYRTWGILGDTLKMKKWIHDLEHNGLKELTEHFYSAWAMRNETKIFLKRSVKEAQSKAMKNKNHLIKMLVKNNIVS